MKGISEKTQLIGLIVMVILSIIYGLIETNSRNKTEKIRIEQLRLQDSINEILEIKKVIEQVEIKQEVISVIEKENVDLEKEEFEKYINESKTKNYTCIKIKSNAVYVIHSLTADQTKWEYYEVGKKKKVFRAKLRGTLPFSIENMNLIGWELTDSNGNRSLGAVAINLETFRRGIVLYKNGHQQVFDEIK